MKQTEDKMKCMVCRLCGDKVQLYHKGIRDCDDIDVLKCEKCGLLQLSEFITSDDYYKDGRMHEAQYNAIDDKIELQTMDLWINETEPDNDRRAARLLELCRGKRVLDFGCGNGGFLKRIMKSASLSCGVELDRTARDYLETEGITVRETIDEYESVFDVITMFQVIEHIKNTDTVLSAIREHLAPGGLLVVETPNSDDALLTKYANKAFSDFTFWIDHVMIYNSENLTYLMEKNGYQLVDPMQDQRYSLANHLFWLSRNEPGGHVKWDVFNDKELNEKYSNALRSEGICDTLFHIYRKGE